MSVLAEGPWRERRWESQGMGGEETASAGE